MTEAEWNACTYPPPMVEFLRRRNCDRKLRLFAVACCRRVWHLLDDPRSRAGVVVAERFADGQATDHELDVAMEEAYAAISQSDSSSVYYAKLGVITYAGGIDFINWIGSLGELSVKARAFENPFPLHFDSAAADQEESAQAELIRCLFGPRHFRRIALDRHWLVSPIPQLADSIYADRAFDRLPILADALEDAGCTNADILNHCRQPGEHVRGCWVIDLLTGRK